MHRRVPNPDHPARRRTACRALRPGEHLLDEAGFDGLERALLRVMREAFIGMAAAPSRPSDPWRVAAAMFPGDPMMKLGGAAVALVQVMALCRRAPFRHSNPDCAGCALVLTGEERHLLLMLHHLRRGRPGAARVHAAMLCEAGPVEALIEAAMAVVHLAPRPARDAA